MSGITRPTIWPPMSAITPPALYWKASKAAMIIILLLAACASHGSAQVLEDFGYNRIEAKGQRPLLVILTEFAGSPPLRQNTAAAAAYFDDLVFKSASPVGIVHDENLRDYFLEISNARFTWRRAGAGVVGPYFFQPADIGTDVNGQLTRITLALEAAAAGGFDFAAHDADSDGTVTANELGVMIVDNYAADGVTLSAGAANRRSNPPCFTPQNSQTVLCLQAAAVSHYASFMAMAHELLHSLGVTVNEDIYGSNDNNRRYSTMGPSPVYGFETFHLDPFLKMKLGWVEPRIHSIYEAGSAAIGAAQLYEDDQPLILYDPYDLHEFFMLEYRSNFGAMGPGYDRNLPLNGNGLVIWHIKVDDNKTPVKVQSLVDPTKSDPAVFIIGAPNMARGQGTAWQSADGFILKDYQLTPYPLKWLDGASTNVRFRIGKTSDSAMKLNVDWGYFADETVPEKKKLVFYSSMWRIGDVGEFNDDGNYTRLTGFNSGYVGYTHIINDGAGLFYYDHNTGSAMLASVDAAGAHTVDTHFPAGTFGAGWTHIVSHRGYLFFYHAGNGMAAIGELAANGFKQYRSYPTSSFGTGWTHIVSTGGGLLFYAQSNGMVAVGDWEYVYAPCGGFCFATVTDISFKTLSWFPAGSFKTDWTSIVDTANGVLFYRKADGFQVMLDVGANGSLSTRMHTAQYLKPGYTHVVVMGTDIMLYDASTGDVSLAQVLEPAPWVYAGSIGTLWIRQELFGYLDSGWTHLTATVPPTLIH